MEDKDYYKILGVNRSDDSSTIKKAFRKLAMQYHPDRNHGDKAAESKFKEINEAYETLKDSQKRATYDQYGSTNPNNSQGFHSQTGGFDNFSDVFGDIFSDFMGGRDSSKNSGHDRRSLKGSDLKYNTSITFQDAYVGLKTKIKFKTYCFCEQCRGEGTKSNKGIQKCPTCHGQGKQRMQQGFFVVEKPCNNCSGSGIFISSPCHSCHGHGRVLKEKELMISIPAGVDDNARIKVTGEGECGIRNARSGDLYIDISIASHKFYKRENSDLHCNITIGMVAAVLGTNVEIPTLDGKIAKISIPPGTQPNAKLRLKAKGMPIIKSVRYGNLYINIKVELPVRISNSQRELLEKFETIKQSGSMPETDSFFSKIKSFISEMRK